MEGRRVDAHDGVGEEDTQLHGRQPVATWQRKHTLFIALPRLALGFGCDMNFLDLAKGPANTCCPKFI